MIYIFPKNYEYKEKLFGILSYSSVIINIIWIIFIYNMLKNVKIEIIYKINILTILEFPLIIYTYLKREEELMYRLWYIIRFIFKRKLYIFKK